MITVQSPIIGPTRGTIAEVVMWCEIHDRPVDKFLRDYLIELWRLCALVGFDASLLTSQSAHECFNPETKKPWDSFWYRSRGNVAGIGITGDPQQNEASHTWANGRDAARAQVAHMIIYTGAYLTGTATHVTPNHGDSGASVARLGIDKPINLYDPRWTDVINAGFARTVKVLGDLGNGKWAVDKKYAEKIAAKANAIFKQEEPMPITFGKVPYPAIVPSYLPASNPLVQEGGAPDVPDAIFWHRMVGSLLGTDGWFHGGHAATAYGVGVAARDGAALAGVIYEWIKPRTGWYGESSGPAVAPYGDGSKFINEVTVNGVNRRSKAIEISGDVNTPMDEKSRHAIAHMTAYWADQKKIPWDVFPIIPGSTRSYVIWHNEITGMAYKTCPGTVVMNETSALIERTRQVMKQYQTAGSPTPEPPPPPVVVPQKPTWFDHGLRTQTDQHDGDLLAQYVERIMKVSPKHKAQKRTSANRGAPVVEVLQPGAKVTSAFMARIDGLDWMWDQDGWAYQLNSFTPKIALPLKPRP